MFTVGIVIVGGVLWAVLGVYGHELMVIALDAQLGPKSGEFEYCCGICDDGLRNVCAPLVFLGPISFFLGIVIALSASMARPFLRMNGKRCVLGRHFQSTPSWHRSSVPTRGKENPV